MAVGEEPQDRRVAIACDGTQTTVTQPGDRGRERVVGVVLRSLRRTQQTHPGRQGRRDIDNMFPGGEQLLGEQPAQAGGGLDRPHPVDVEWFGPREQPVGLMPIGGHGESRDL